MNSNERYEYMAELFYKETGMMAPGKDNPAAFGGADELSEREIFEAWDKWTAEFYEKLFDLHKSTLDKE